MKKLIIIFSIFLFAISGTVCFAGDYGTSQRIGGTTFHNFDDGTTGTSQRMGGTTFHNFSDGTTGTSQRMGGTTFHNL